jgi:Dyp-type peroxidase family
VAIAEPLLDIHDLQGGILAGFNKDHQILAALRFRDIATARAWLRRIVPMVSSMAEVNQFNTLFRARRRAVGEAAAGLVATWMNIAFSRNGIAKLTSEADANALPDSSFRAGLERGRSLFLGDPAPAPTADPTANWVVGGTGRVPDAFLIVASDDPAHLDRFANALMPLASDGVQPPEVVWREAGATIPGMPGHEHFGFRDGISQPGVRGLLSRRPKVFLTPRLLKPAPPGEVDFAKPGQPLVWPGNFVLGYQFTSRDDGSPQDPLPLARPWFKNGSFLVFRRLNQNVAGFSQFLTAEAARLGLTPAHLGALLVGRWPSGAPLSRTAFADNAALAADPLANNDFLFTRDTPAPDYDKPTPPDPFPRAREGSAGPVCPHAAHIVKVNPRDFDTDVGPAFDTLTRRILRRGLPFGPPPANPAQGDDGIERGLHLLCYQASIVDQFEFLQQRWANSTGGPLSGGHDMIIGQTPDRRRSIDLPSLPVVTAPAQWVTPTGGGYFFAPSLTALRDVLAR